MKAIKTGTFDQNDRNMLILCLTTSCGKQCEIAKLLREFCHKLI